MEDWLRGGLPGRSERTWGVNREATAPLLELIGSRPLSELTAGDVRAALDTLSASYSTRYLQLGRAALGRAIKYAEAHDRVGRNVATLVDPPKGREGRPSRSFTLDQARALLKAAGESRLNAYVVLSLTVGVRTEEARQLCWDHLDLDGDPDADPPVPPSVAVLRSVRQGGDTKTPYLADRKVMEKFKLVTSKARGKALLADALSDESGSSWPEAHYLGLPPQCLHRPLATGKETDPASQEDMRASIVVLSRLLATRLAQTARLLDSADRAACREAAQCAGQIHSLLTGEGGDGQGDLRGLAAGRGPQPRR